MIEGKGMSLSLHNCQIDITNNREELCKFLKDIVTLAKMNGLGPSHIVKGAAHLPGLTGVQIIETSHIALHCFSKNTSYMFNIESCKDFNENRLKIYILQKFKPKTYRINALYTI